MKTTAGSVLRIIRLLSGSVLLIAVTSAFAQVNPFEILNPRLKATEQEYLPQLQSLKQSINSAKYPFPFRLARYLNAKPGQKEAFDSNGIEFVYFQDSVVLKFSGLYNVAFDATELSRNERASRTFRDVVAPMLRQITELVPQSANCDGIGFEIVYGTRDTSREHDYEGKESLTVVFSRDDAFAYSHASGEEQRQLLLNRSDIFVNGKEFGLAMGQRDSFNVEALDRSVPRQAAVRSSPTRTSPAHTVYVSEATDSPAARATPAMAVAASQATSEDPALMQAQSQLQLSSIGQEDGARLHLAEAAEPAFESMGDQRLLHFTLRNTLSFDRSATSIYKRAAQSFDLFLAPELKEFSKKLPQAGGYNAVEFSVLNDFGSPGTSSETIDYICPLNSLRSFVENTITSQDVVNQSVVLVNGVRIALNLQLVE